MKKITYDFMQKTSSVVDMTAGEIAALSFTTSPPPTIVTMRQARIALLGAGLLSSVNSTIASMPGVEGDEARIAWEYAATVDRASQLVSGITAALSLTTSQLDTLFTTAAAL